MITKFLISLPAFLLQALVSLLPAGEPVRPEWVTSVHTIWTSVQQYAFIVPEDTLLTMLKIALVYHIAVAGVFAFNWLLKKVPGMS